MSLQKAFLIFLFFFFSFSLSSQEAPFSRGVNLSNWFQSGNPEQVQFNKYNLQDFQQIKSLGCDVIRVPVNLYGMTSGSPSFTIEPLFYSFFDSLIYWSEEADIHLILDNHTFEENVINGKDNGDFLNKVWPQLAYRYNGEHDKLYFELLNEPHDITDQKWNQIQKELLDKIRAIDPDRWIIVGPASWNSYHNLQNMPILAHEKLIYTFHFYDPFLFTHQGASWVSPSMVPLQGVPFPYNPGEMPDLPSTFIGSWLESAYNNYSSDGNIYKVRQLIDLAVAFKNARNVPVYCGEFGVLYNHADDNDRSFWYETVRQHLEENGIAWTIWDYHGGFGLFEKGGNGLFNHDLNVGLLEKLGLNVPAQSEFQIFPDSSNIVIYDDFIGKNIFESSSSSGSLSMYNQNALNGNYCIQWDNPSQYNHIGFDFRPDKDLSVLEINDYAIEFWIRGNRPGTKVDIRFLDTKTEEEGDRPWRMRYTIDESKVNWDGSWQKLSIPLEDFTEHGSWDDNTWFNPIGAFDWKAIDRFEIVNEFGFQNPISLAFDEIVIRGKVLNIQDYSNKKISIFPIPAYDQLMIKVDASFDIRYWEIHDMNGRLLLKNNYLPKDLIDISSLENGYYIIKIYNMNKLFNTETFIKL